MASCDAILERQLGLPNRRETPGREAYAGVLTFGARFGVCYEQRRFNGQ
jgi:hypothetical protein